jgi:uncharacterized protein
MHLMPPADETAGSVAATWQPLPSRSRPLFLIGAVVPLAIAGLVAGGVVALIASTVLDLPRTLVVACIAGLAGLVGAAFGVWLGTSQYRHTAWRLDEQGLAVRRGRLWQRETRVPANRVQHLDIKRGPLQRGRELSTLVVHTAGTRHSSVTVPNLDAADAERLRERLGRAIDAEDD